MASPRSKLGSCLIVLLCLAVSGCRTSGKTGLGQKEQTAGVSISMKPKAKEKFSFGRAIGVVFLVKNASDRAIVVLSIHTRDNQGQEPISLAGSAYGDLRKLTTEDAYELNSMAQRAKPAQ